MATVSAFVGVALRGHPFAEFVPIDFVKTGATEANPYNQVGDRSSSQMLLSEDDTAK